MNTSELQRWCKNISELQVFTNSSCATHYKEDCSLCIKTKEKCPPWQRERLFLSKAEDFMLPRDNSFIFCRVSFGSGVVVAVCGMHRSVLAQQRSHFTSAAKKTKILDSLAHWHAQINKAGHKKKKIGVTLGSKESKTHRCCWEFTHDGKEMFRLCLFQASLISFLTMHLCTF